MFRSYVLFAYLFSGVHALNAISRRSAHVKVGFHFPLTIHAIVCLLYAVHVGRSQHARAVVFGTFDFAFSPLFACLFQSVVLVSFKSVFVVFIFQVSCELLGFRSKNKNIKINTVFLDVLTAVGTVSVTHYGV